MQSPSSTRRSKVSRWICSLALGLALLPLAQAGGTLRVLAWPGYADLDLVRVFEQRTDSKVEVTFVDTDEALWQKIAEKNVPQFDVFAVNTAELQRYVTAALVAPIDITKVPNVATQLPRFRDRGTIPNLVQGGQVFAIPYTYAEMGLIYDKKQVKEPPDSIRALWDTRYRGKVLLYNGGTHMFSLAAQKVGDTTPFFIDPKEWPVLVQELIALRRNALTFYTQPEESVALFRNKQAAILFANYGSQQFKLLQQAGADVGYAIPKDGALAWLDCWVITRRSQNTELALAWINYFLEAQPSEALTSRQGLANTTTETGAVGAGDKIRWLEPVENADYRNRLWGRIVSGDRLGKVLVP
jgi:putative spermidine/putrescine transport system substrate-binding protein